ncbi:MAG: MBL fold metallo-hydrolase [Anaerolineales bacterium]|jgi:L-ascorbate metabolism protein UlaG (beta-lactamase superfamily)
MDITWYGLSCFRIIERGMISVVTDPYDPEVGLPDLKLRADVITVSNDAPAHNYTKAVKNARRVVDGPGEYEIGGVFITAVRMKPKSSKEKKEANGNTLCAFDYGGITVAHLGDLDSVPSQAQIEDLGAVDIALVPVGGGGALSPSEAAEVISLIEPSIVIPMHFKTGKEKISLGDVSGFLKEMGIEKPDPLDSLSVSKSSLTDETQVIVLQPAVS